MSKDQEAFRTVQIDSLVSYSSAVPEEAPEILYAMPTIFDHLLNLKICKCKPTIKANPRQEIDWDLMQEVMDDHYPHI